MSPAEQSSKLSQIASISSMDEWQGWHDAAKSRGFFPGELAALMRQKEALS